jgi:hypothetical protein
MRVHRTMLSEALEVTVDFHDCISKHKEECNCYYTALYFSKADNFYLSYNYLNASNVYSLNHGAQHYTKRASFT